MANKRRTYTPEFKGEAVKLVTEKNYSLAEAARSLGIHETLLRSWKQAVEKQGEQAFPGHGTVYPKLHLTDEWGAIDVTRNRAAIRCSRLLPVATGGAPAQSSTAAVISPPWSLHS